MPQINSTDSIKLMKLIEKRLDTRGQVLTINKKVIVKILLENSEHLTVDDIVGISEKNKYKKLDRTTVYRILSKFESYDIVDSIVLNDNKKRYELTYLKNPHYHIYCNECNNMSEFENLDIHDKFLSQLKNENFQPMNFNIIINGVCKKCQ